MMSGFDPATIPLQGVHLIEASAGTGKTHSIGSLYLRLVLESDLAPGKIEKVINDVVGKHYNHILPPFEDCDPWYIESDFEKTLAEYATRWRAGGKEELLSLLMSKSFKENMIKEHLVRAWTQDMDDALSKAAFPYKKLLVKSDNSLWKLSNVKLEASIKKGCDYLRHPLLKLNDVLQDMAVNLEKAHHQYLIALKHKLIEYAEREFSKRKHPPFSPPPVRPPALSTAFTQKANS